MALYTWSTTSLSVGNKTFRQARQYLHNFTQLAYLQTIVSSTNYGKTETNLLSYHMCR